MNETDQNMNYQSRCSLISYAPPEGPPELYELKIKRGNRDFMVEVSTYEVITGIQTNNQGLKKEEMRNEKIFPINELGTVEEVCGYLSQIPFDKLEPFIEPINKSDENEDDNEFNV